MVVNIMGPFWGTLNIRGRIIIGIQKGTIIFTTSHVGFYWEYIGIIGILEKKMEATI